jgi:2-hydroxymuconate-semialdehyde hydrolase
MSIATSHVDLDRGPAVLLLHGTAPGTTAAANFGHLLPVLARHHRVVAPDLWGFGASDKPAGLAYGPQLWVEQAFALLDKLGIGDAVVLGNSMGARIALTMAVRRPGLVRGLVLFSARLHPSRSRAQDLIRAYRPDRIAMAELLRECFATDPAAVTPDQIDQRYRDSAEPGAHEALQSLFAGLPAAGPGPSEDELRALSAPALVVAGREDRVVPFGDSVELAGLLPDADLHVLAGTGHWFPVERADIVTPLVLDLLARATSPRELQD